MAVLKRHVISAYVRAQNLKNANKDTLFAETAGKDSAKQ